MKARQRKRKLYQRMCVNVLFTVMATDVPGADIGERFTIAGVVKRLKRRV